MKNNGATVWIHLHILHCRLATEQCCTNIYCKNYTVVIIIEIFQRCSMCNAGVAEETVNFTKAIVGTIKKFFTIFDVSKVCVNKDTLLSHFANLFQNLVG